MKRTNVVIYILVKTMKSFMVLINVHKNLHSTWSFEFNSTNSINLIQFNSHLQTDLCVDTIEFAKRWGVCYCQGIISPTSV